MIRNFLYVMTIGLLLISSSHSKTKFSKIKKALKEYKYGKFNHSRYDKKINEWNIVEISPKAFESSF